MITWNKPSRYWNALVVENAIYPEEREKKNKIGISHGVQVVAFYLINVI